MPELIPAAPGSPDTSWPSGKTFGQLTPAQKAAAIKTAMAQLQAELEAAAHEIGRIMDEVADDA